MRTFLIVISSVVVLGGPFWLGSGVRAHEDLPQTYQRALTPEVAQWEVNLLAQGRPRGSLGPIPAGGAVARQELEKLGVPDGSTAGARFMSPNVKRVNRKEPGQRSLHFLGFGLHLDGVTTTSDGEQLRVAQIVLGNPWAMSAEDPVVKTCPFKLPGGITFGMGIEEVERRLMELAPTHGLLVPRTYRDGHHAWSNRVGGVTVELPSVTLHYMNDQLVALTLGG